MSVIGNVVDAVIVDVKAAIIGIHTDTEPRNVTSLTARELPHCFVIATAFESEPIDFRQETHTWTVELMLVQDGGTRESLELRIEAIRNQIYADPTLGGVVDRAFMQSSVPHTQSDAPRLHGVLVVTAIKVKAS